jgi:maltose-binding protein MalE
MIKKLIVAIAAIMVSVLTGCNIQYESQTESDAENITVSDADSVIDFCYTDEKYKEFFEFCEKEFEKQNEGIDVVLHYQKENMEYLDDIVGTTYSESSFMDVYMLSDSNLGTAYLAGVAAKNTYEVFSEENYSVTALNACKYGSTLVGYPFSYDTTFFLYRKDLMEVKDVQTFADLMLFSENADYSAEEYMMIEAIYRCDINDIYNMYGYLGEGISIGGPTGTDKDIVDVYNTKTEKLSKEYFELLEYFSINTEEKYDDILSKFLEGKYLSIVAGTQSLDKIFESELEYGITALPDYSAALETAPLATTQCVVVNMYSPNNAVASDFARFVTYEAAPYLYDMAQALSARKTINYDNEALAGIYQSYEKASIKNKMQYGEQFYPLMEIAMHNMATGSLAEEELTKVQEHMKSQLK